ncbi:MAG: hypothetical protein P4L81_06425 [Candidatus Pacebacteria bacterium]|nr:hypothetical protein [Candidatus Paceibacterota bacterium]
MFERPPKKRERKEEVEIDDDSELEEAREQITEHFKTLSTEEKIEYARNGLRVMPEKIRLNQERIAHLNAQMEHLTERLSSLEGAERKFLEEELVEKESLRDEYVENLQEMEDMLKHQQDFLDRTLN